MKEDSGTARQLTAGSTIWAEGLASAEPYSKGEMGAEWQQLKPAGLEYRRGGLVEEAASQAR
jgi:hypothetical protein